ncbi:hypothetical protein GGR58DRAFT_506548 [Xylaria digitata]|nr:hypothetical protein GGR58DRAFT_506548 [Xylaria digitata]
MPGATTYLLSKHKAQTLARPMMDECCKFKQGQESCGRPTFTWSLCKEHEILRVETHNFYKLAEVHWRKVNPDESHQYLVILSGRECDNHTLYAGGLFGYMKQEEVLLAKRRKGFVVEGASYENMLSVATRSLKQAFLDWHESDKKKQISHYIRGFPRAIAYGTEVPEAVKQRMNPPPYTD